MYRGYFGVILGYRKIKWKLLHYNRVCIGVVLGLYWDNGKENGNYRGYRGYIWLYMSVSPPVSPRVFLVACCLP